MSQFRIGMNHQAPSDPDEERGWDERARVFHASDDRIDTLSDGVVTFTGLIAAAISLPHRLLLIDEPEAFLHPPLARLLGASLASLTQERGASLVAATHSAEFLMGCVESGANATIVRLTYELGSAGARVLPPTGLRGLTSDPLLRSTRALTGLFHRGVVVGESDSDRCLYEEINRRLVEANRGSADTMFTNAQNWQTIPRVIGPLRALGVPSAGIIDLDAVVAPKREWEKFYKVMGTDEAASQSLEADRVRVMSLLQGLGNDASGTAVYKIAGIAALGVSDRAATQAFLDRLAGYGVFVVDAGELEGWLPSLGVSRTIKRSDWIVRIFRSLGSNPGTPTYVKPAANDVWQFVDKIAGWVNNPNRLGMG